jgi:hypothetical protein
MKLYKAMIWIRDSDKLGRLVNVLAETLKASVARMSVATSGSSDFPVSRISLRSCGLRAILYNPSLRLGRSLTE